MRIGSGGVLFFGMATLFGRLSRQSNSHSKLSDIDWPYGATSPYPCTNAVGPVEFVFVVLPPSGAARSHVDQGERHGSHRIKLQNEP